MTSAAQPAEPKQPAKEPSFYVASAGTMRETLKWLATSLAAVGAVLVAGLTLASLGTVEGDRLAIAIVGLGTALACIAASAYVCAMGIQSGANVSLDTVADTSYLRKEVERSKSLVAMLPGKTVAGLRDELREAAENQIEAYNKAAAEDGTDEDARRFELTASRVRELNRLSKEVVDRGQYFKLRRTTRIGGPAVVLLALIASAGVIAFAWGANPPETEETSWPTVVRTPVQADLRLDESGKNRLENRLGKDCVAAKIPVTVIEDLDDDAYRVAVNESSSCPAKIVTSTRFDGILEIPAA